MSRHFKFSLFENNGNTVLATKENTQTSISHIPRKYEGRVFWSSSRIGNIICQRNTFRLIPRNTPPSLPIVCNTIRIYELNTISFVNGHKKWYWHAEKEAEQKGRTIWICQLKRCCFDKSSFREKKIKLLTFDKSSFSDRTVLMGLCGLLDHTRVLPTFTTTWHSTNVWKHPTFENVCLGY